MSQLPDAIRKRDIMFGVYKSSPKELEGYAAAFLERGWINDAADFYHQLGNKEILFKLRQTAVADGDTFLHLKISRLLEDSNHDGLLECAKNAEKFEKWRYAIRGYEKLEMIEKLEEIKAKIANDGDILAEAAERVFIPQSEEEIALHEASKVK